MGFLMLWARKGRPEYVCLPFHSFIHFTDIYWYNCEQGTVLGPGQMREIRLHPSPAGAHSPEQEMRERVANKSTVRATTLHGIGSVYTAGIQKRQYYRCRHLWTRRLVLISYYGDKDLCSGRASGEK
jgi:hypothetical protein